MHLINYQSLRDDELLEQVKLDDCEAFQCIYKKYSSKLYSSAYNLLRDKQRCEDLIQDLFIQLWIKRNELDIRSLRAYLYMAIRNKVLMQIRSGKTHLDISIIEQLKMQYSADEKLLENDLHDMLDKSISTLPEKCGLIFSLSRKKQLSNKEIAEMLNISGKTVENQITIALRRLRTSLGDFLLLAGFLLSFF